MGNEQSTTQEKLDRNSILDPKNSATAHTFDSSVHVKPVSDIQTHNTDTKILPPKIDIESKKPTMEDLNRSSHTVFGSEHTWNDIPEKALTSSSKNNNFRMIKAHQKPKVSSSLPTFVPDTKEYIPKE